MRRISGQARASTRIAAPVLRNGVLSMFDPLPRYGEPEPVTIAELRARSLRVVESVFGTLAVLCAAAAAVVHVFGASLNVPAAAQEPVATAFLLLSLCDLVLLFVCRAWFLRDMDF